MDSDLNFFKKNGYLVKKNLIIQKKINKINKIVNKVILKENKANKKMKQMELNLMIIITLFTIQTHHKIKKF